MVIGDELISRFDSCAESLMELYTAVLVSSLRISYDEPHGCKASSFYFNSGSLGSELDLGEREARVPILLIRNGGYDFDQNLSRLGTYRKVKPEPIAASSDDDGFH